MLRRLGFVLGLIALTGAGAPFAQAEECTATDYAAAVDRSGAELSKESRAVQPKIQQRMRRYQEATGLSDTDYEDAALQAIRDDQLEQLDAKSSELLLKIDGLGRLPDGKPPSCAEVADIDALGKELLGIVRTKSDYILARLDAKIAEAEAKSGRVASAGDPASKTEPAKKEAPSSEDKKTEAAKPEAAKAETPKSEVAKSAAPTTKSQPPKAEPKAAKAEPKPAAKPQVAMRDDWSAKTKPNAGYQADPDESAPVPAPVPGGAGSAAGEADGYSIDEIRDATRGFFGTISTNLASVIEHAFKTSGRPTAYVLGTEGGGAFLAGLRFGEGTLYMRHRPETRKVWWHGPSIGGDFGASGTRTMFLIYKLDNEQGLYRSFTGVDGSAFFVGGVGMTVLKGGDVIMAPIRTGLGLRVGANVGYVRFTPTATWNPF
ncbi:MAG: DUF1134 domain-containing protein [Hyphomicrobiaceae bacterium]|nr:DUF1134 domain-containing protein [Hyphomicrobiaceae bacterium]